MTYFEVKNPVDVSRSFLLTFKDVHSLAPAYILMYTLSVTLLLLPLFPEEQIENSDKDILSNPKGVEFQVTKITSYYSLLCVFQYAYLLTQLDYVSFLLFIVM